MYYVFFALFLFLIAGLVYAFVFKPAGIELPKLPEKKQKAQSKSRTLVAAKRCPSCGSGNVYYSQSQNEWACGDCRTKFEE